MIKFGYYKMGLVGAISMTRAVTSIMLEASRTARSRY
jgi:hypothetical protein